MLKIIGIAALALVLFMVASFIYMRRKRTALFQRVAVFETTAAKQAASKMVRFLAEHHAAVDRHNMDSVIPILEDLLVSPFGYMKLDPTDNESAVFACGSFIGEWAASEWKGSWGTSPDAGPSVTLREGDVSIILFPVQKAAMIREFRQRGDLAAYVSSLRAMGQALPPSSP